MPEINIGGTPAPEPTPITIGGTPAPADQTPEIGQTPEMSNTGMTPEEMRDPAKIHVTVTDSNTPIVVLFGPPSCGKTMTLIRLVRYLRSQGYTIKPDPAFRPAYDTVYQDMCEHFDEMINSNDAAAGTDRISFMLVKVYNQQGRAICQILESPGESYFSPDNPNAAFPGYVNHIINNSNRTIWMIMVEPTHTNPSMGDQATRANYATKVAKLRQQMVARDKVVFVFNKIDMTPYVISQGVVNNKEAMKHVNQIYENIFSPFANVNPLTKWITPYNFDFVAFQTGSYEQAADGSRQFTLGSDAYPRRLWEILRKRING